MVGFIFGGNTGETPETLKRKRSVAEALAARTSTAPKNVGEGLSAIGNALIYRALMNKVDAGDAAGRASAEADRNAFMSGYRSPVADALMPPSSKSAGIPMTESAGEVAATSPTTGDTYEPFINTIKEGGLTNPYGLAAVAATGRAESGWSAANANRTWSDPSESGQPGTAGGIMSWRGPRYQALAATGDLSPQGQAKFFLQEDPDLIAKLNNAKSLEEAQGLMNRAWAFAGYNRPGGESSRRLAYAKGYLPNFQDGGTEVASLDPSAGMSASDAINAAATPSGYVDPAVASQNAQPAPVTAPAAAQAPEFDAGRFGPRMNLAEMPPTQADIAPQLQTQTAALTGQTSPVVAALARPGSVVDAPAPVASASAAPAPAAVAPSQPVQSTQAQGKPQEVAQAGPGADYFPAAPNVPSQTGPSMDQIMRVLNNPYATETDKALAMSELERRQKMNDPAYKMQLEKSQIELQRLRSPQPEYNYTTLPDGTVLRTDKRGGAPEKVYESAPKPTTNQQDYQYYRDFETKNGRTPLGPLEWEQAQRKAGAASTNVTVGEGDKFYENLDKKNAETFASLSDTGMQARSKLAQIDRLEGLMANAPQGAVGALKQAAGEWGIPTDGLSDIQAASALLEKMVPEQRAPGSGTMSDADIKMFRASLPRIINQPGGNQLIFDTMRGIAQYEMQIGAIADKVANRERKPDGTVYTPADGRRDIANLQNPLSNFKMPAGPTPNEGIKPGHTEDGYRFKGGNPSNPDSWEKVQ